MLLQKWTLHVKFLNFFSTNLATAQKWCCLGVSHHTMSAFLPNKRLTMDFTYEKVEAVDVFAIPALHHDHSLGLPSAASSGVSTTTCEMHRNISQGKPCFIMKRPSYTLEGACWVNPVRKDAAQKLEVVSSLACPACDHFF